MLPLRSGGQGTRSRPRGAAGTTLAVAALRAITPLMVLRARLRTDEVHAYGVCGWEGPRENELMTRHAHA